MKQAVIVYGVGEIGSVLARGFLKLGHPVFPVTRESDLNTALSACDPVLIIVAVGEAALPETLAQFPHHLAEKLVLIQNELLPKDWAGFGDPTVISVWFEKKQGMDSKVVVPSPVYGTHAALLVAALATLDLPAYEVHSKEALLFELVRKNFYILTSNIAGLRTGGTVSQLWGEHRDFATAVVEDVCAIQEYLTGAKLDKDALITGMVKSFKGDPEHGCMGRSAPARLARALAIADEAGLAVPTLREIAALTED